MSSRQVLIKDNTSNNTNKISLKTKFTLILLAIVLLVVLYFIEKLLFTLVNFICYFLFLSIFIFILLHLLLIRFIIIIFIFPGKNFFFKKIMRHENGKIFGNQFYKILKVFKLNMESLKLNKKFDHMKLPNLRSSI